MHHHFLPTHSLLIDEWIVEKTNPFQELLISWNALRPKQGYYAIDVSILTKTGWSSWVPYAEWGSDFQFGHVVQKEGIRVSQDTVEVVYGQGFQIRVRAENGASMNDFRALHVDTNPKPETSSLLVSSVQLPVPLLSQMALPDPRHRRLCSPTSLAATLRFLDPLGSFDPLSIADRVWDQKSDIYGNWVLNVAEGYSSLKGRWFCWAEKLSGFDSLLTQLQKGTPVVVSVRGPLVGSAQPYEQGHLLVVKGYEADKKQVLCMDPAFETDAKTEVAYCLDSFIVAWQRRGRLAYLFSAPSTVLSETELSSSEGIEPLVREFLQP